MEWSGIPHAFLDLGFGYLSEITLPKFDLNWQQFQAGSSIFKFILFDGFHGTEPGIAPAPKSFTGYFLSAFTKTFGQNELGQDPITLLLLSKSEL